MPPPPPPPPPPAVRPRPRRGPGARALGVRRPHPHLVVRAAPQSGNLFRGAGAVVVRVLEVRAERAVLHVVIRDRRSRVLGRRPGHRQARRERRRHRRRRRRAGRLVHVQHGDRHRNVRGARSLSVRRHGDGVFRAPLVVVGDIRPGAKLPAGRVDGERRRVRPAQGVPRRVRRRQRRPDGGARRGVLLKLAPGAVALGERRARFGGGAAAGFRPVAGAHVVAGAHAHLVGRVLDKSGDGAARGGAGVFPVDVSPRAVGAVLHVVVDDVVGVFRGRPGRRQAGGGGGGDLRRGRRVGTERPTTLQQPEHGVEAGRRCRLVILRPRRRAAPRPPRTGPRRARAMRRRSASRASRNRNRGGNRLLAARPATASNSSSSRQASRCCDRAHVDDFRIFKMLIRSYFYYQHLIELCHTRLDLWATCAHVGKCRAATATVQPGHFTRVRNDGVVWTQAPRESGVRRSAPGAHRPHEPFQSVVVPVTESDHGPVPSSLPARTCTSYSLPACRLAIVSAAVMDVSSTCFTSAYCPKNPYHPMERLIP